MNRRTSVDRLSELAEVFNKRFIARLRQDFTDEVARAYIASPLGPHDDKTARVVRALGYASVAGKEIVISLGNDGPWGIGRIVIGQPGNFERIAGQYQSYEDALRAVFSIRRSAFAAS